MPVRHGQVCKVAVCGPEDLFEEVDTDNDLVNDALRLTVADTSTPDPFDVFAGFSVTFSGLDSDDITALQNSMIMSDVI